MTDQETRRVKAVIGGDAACIGASRSHCNSRCHAKNGVYARAALVRRSDEYIPGNCTFRLKMQMQVPLTRTIQSRY